MNIRFLSVCSGIEAASTAWKPLGWTPVAFSEIEPFPSSVLTSHYPHVPNWGDMTKFEEWPDETIDLLCGGTPCQSFSVAGLRKGLADPRGNLMLTFGAIAAKYRPRWLVWENVPGVLSSNGGRDFGSFLGLLAELGYGFAYKILDAQYVRVQSHPRAVPQRRRRVFVVGHSGGLWQRAAAVLFERESLRRHPAPRRQARESVAGTLSARTKGGGGLGTDFDLAGGFVSHTLLGKPNCSHAADKETYVTHSLRGEGFDASEDGTGRGTPLIPVIVGQAMSSKWAKGTAGPAGDEHHNLIPVPFGTTQITPASNYSAHAHCIAFPEHLSGTQCGDDGAAYTLEAQHRVQAIAYLECEALYNKGFITLKEGNASTQETYTGTLLRTLLQEVGEEAFAKWGLGILDSLQSPEILRQALHGFSIRPAAFSRSWVVYCALSRSENRAAWLLQSLREAGCKRCASQGWEPSEQLSIELGAYLSELSQPGAQASRFMRDLWWAAQGAGVLREALSAVQEVGRSTGGQGQSILGSSEGRGEESDENVLSSGMQCEVSRERVLHETCAAGEARDSREGTAEQERSGKGWVGETPFAVRRLTVEECEFLQGFPRGYSKIPWRKKPASECPDGPRYKALGNSWAINCARWIGERIDAVDRIVGERT